MTLLDRITARYYRQHPARAGRPIDLPDWLPAVIEELEAALERKSDRPEPRIPRFSIPQPCFTTNPISRRRKE